MACDYINVLNLAKDGKWDEAHQIVQACSDETACLIHAYLHRVEGDISNARYWYGRANIEMPENSLDNELLRLFEWVNRGNR